MSGEWHLTKIPKVMHVYFGGRMPWIRYLTIATFKKHNPDWRVKFYYPDVVNPTKPWNTPEHKYEDDYEDFGHLAKTTADEAIMIDTAKMFGVSIPEVHRSDFLRWHLLSTEGGLWSDMDIVYFKPISEVLFNTPGNAHIDTCICMNHYGHSVGFLLASPNNLFFSEIKNKSKINQTGDSYQYMGATLCNRILPIKQEKEKEKVRRPHHRPHHRYDTHREKTWVLTDNIYNIPMDVVYAYDAERMNHLFTKTDKSRFLQNSIGCHWYAGSAFAGVFLIRTNGGVCFNNVPLMEQLIMKINEDYVDIIGSSGTAKEKTTPPKRLILGGLGW